MRYPSLVVRAAVLLVLVLASACSGRSESSDHSSAGQSGEAGEDSGGSSNGGSGASSSGGSEAGGGAEPSGGSGGSSSGGADPDGGSAGASPMTGGTSMTGGSTATGGFAGLSGTGGGGMSGSAGSGASGGDRGCDGPAPGGCPRTRCRDGQTCMLASGRCIPSQCDCIYGQWQCSTDCGGGMCVDGSSACTTPDPSGCASDDDCTGGDVCMPSPLAVCIPVGCACGPMGGWQCREDCGGGVCVPPTCPMGCEPQMNAFCGSERITWVCTGEFNPREFLDAGCTDPGTQVTRYCCPPGFRTECQ